MKIKNENIGLIDPRIDEYINQILNIADGYNFDGQPRKILNYVVYLLLNKNFQFVLQSFRLSLCMPIDGLKDEEEQNLWEVKFKEVVNKYHNGEEIDKGVKSLIDRVEKDLNRSLVDKEHSGKPGTIVIDICADSVSKTTSYIFRYLGLRDTKNLMYWLIIVRELLLLNSPAKIISHLSKWSKVFGTQSISFEQRDNRVKMSIELFPDTTIKDIEQLIESKRSRISEEINKIKGQARENQSKTDDIKRDYFIYRTYKSHGVNRHRGEKIYLNISKSDAVKKVAQTAKYLESESIRKIVNRMNKRIKSTFPDSPAELNAFLGPLAPKRRT